MSIFGYLFGLPSEVLESVAVLGPEKQLSLSVDEFSRELDSPEQVIKQSSEKGSATCMTCGQLTFQSSEEQRQHYRSDWHKFNVKRKIANQKHVDEETFERMVEEEEEVGSLSGSEDEQQDLQNVPNEGGEMGSLAIQGPQIVFSTSDGEQQFSIWSTLLSKERISSSHSQSTLLNTFCSLTTYVSDPQNKMYWAVIMLSGGHFAAAVYHIQPYVEQQTSKRKKQRNFKQIQMLQSPKQFPITAVVHKTFHRYVVRAKAGGKQSSKDAQGGAIHSAGASLRRYNEAALQRDISQTLSSWRKEFLDQCRFVFVSVSQTDSNTIFNTTTGVDEKEERVRRIPFSTRRPTFEETGRVVRMLATAWTPENQTQIQVQQSEVNDLEQIQNQGEQLSSVIENSTQSMQAGFQQEQSEETSEDLPSNATQQIHSFQKQLYETPLHTASRNGDANLIDQLLESGEDPTLIDGNGLTPYNVALDKSTRDVFRRFMARQPDAWDYQAAGIPSALTEEMEKSQAAKKAEKRARQKAKQADLKKQLKSQQQDEEEKIPRMTVEEEIQAALQEASKIASKATSSKGVSNKGPYSSKNKVSQNSDKASSQSREADLKMRRELMAKAAEERMKNLKNIANSQKLY